MSPESVFATLITCILGIAGLWLKHILDCRDRDRRSAESHEELAKALESFRAQIDRLIHECERLSRNAHADRQYLREVGMVSELTRQKLTEIFERK